MLTATAEPRTARAPLGNKTTNAKARTGQQTSRGLEKTAIKPTPSIRPKQGPPQIESSKLEVHTDKNPLEEEEIEYAPPRPVEAPYQSDIIPEGALTFETLKPENLFRGYYQHYYNRKDENGVPLKERQMQERRQRDFQRGDEQILKDMEEFDWSIGDIPSSKQLLKKPQQSTATKTMTDNKKTQRPVFKAPPTIASRKAASALSMPIKPLTTTQAKAGKPAAVPRKPTSVFGRKPILSTMQPKPAPTQASRANAVAASRSTIGYSKGRSAISVVQGRNDTAAAETLSEPPARPRSFTRTASTASTASDATITPARFAQTQTTTRDCKKPEFMSIFDAELDDQEEEDIPGAPELDNFEEDDFQLSTDF